MPNYILELYQEQLNMDAIEFLIWLTITIIGLWLFKQFRNRYIEIEKIKSEKRINLVENLYILNYYLKNCPDKLASLEAQKLISKVLIYVSEPLGNKLIAINNQYATENMKEVEELLEKELIHIKKRANLDFTVSDTKRSIFDFIGSVNKIWFTPIFVPIILTFSVIFLGLYFSLITIGLQQTESLLTQIINFIWIISYTVSIMTLMILLDVLFTEIESVWKKHKLVLIFFLIINSLFYFFISTNKIVSVFFAIGSIIVNTFIWRLIKVKNDHDNDK